MSLSQLRIYVSVDFEGLPGIASVSQLVPKAPQYSDGRELVTRVVETIVSELRSLDVTDIMVADSHGYMANLIPWRIDARMLMGFPRPVSMMLGVEEYTAAMMIGYHAAAGTVGGFLDHTYSSAAFQRIRVNGELASEFLLNAVYAGEKEVPVILVAGDDRLRGQVMKYTPWAVFVPLKRGVARYAAVSDPVDRVLDQLRRGVREAIDRLKRGDVKPLTLEKPYRIQVEFKNQALADIAAGLPGFKRVDGYTVEFEAESMEYALTVIELLALANAGVNYLLQQLR